MSKQEINAARKLAYASMQDVIICENRGIEMTYTTEYYIKHYLAVYDIKATVTPTGQIVTNKRFN